MMEPTHPRLFIGFPIEGTFSQLLDQVNPTLKKTFIQSEGDYLQEIGHEGRRFLGKSVEGPYEVDALELCQENVYSLLRKLAPEFPFEDHPLVLFPTLR
jgi:hypothetical protein